MYDHTDLYLVLEDTYCKLAEIKMFITDFFLRDPMDKVYVCYLLMLKNNIGQIKISTARQHGDFRGNLTVLLTHIDKAGF